MKNFVSKQRTIKKPSPPGESSVNDLACKICYQLNIDSKQCKQCLHVFCAKCIEQWLKQQKSCPFKCSHPMILQELNQSTLNQISINFKTCPNSWCNANIKVADYDQHLKTCKKEEGVEVYFRYGYYWENKAQNSTERFTQTQAKFSNKQEQAYKADQVLPWKQYIKKKQEEKVMQTGQKTNENCNKPPQKYNQLFQPQKENMQCTQYKNFNPYSNQQNEKQLNEKIQKLRQRKRQLKEMVKKNEDEKREMKKKFSLDLRNQANKYQQQIDRLNQSVDQAQKKFAQDFSNQFNYYEGQIRLWASSRDEIKKKLEQEIQNQANNYQQQINNLNSHVAFLSQERQNVACRSQYPQYPQQVTINNYAPVTLAMPPYPMQPRYIQ